MATSKMRLRIVTPENIKYDEDVEMVILRCITGDWGILPRHAPYSAILDLGVLRILNERAERRMAVFGGIAQVQDNVVTILSNEAQWPEDIDVAFAESERERISALMQESVDRSELQRERLNLHRISVQIKVGSYKATTITELEEVE
jgi:F-type H+-transporting ATPase subunit epsilon